MSDLSFGDLVDEAVAAAKKHGGWCTVGLWRAALDDTNRAQFDTAMASDKPSTVLHKAMKAMGYDRGASTVQRHRRGECDCVR